jgi:hypothetical protein
MSRAVDLYFSFRFLKLLTEPWKSSEAYSEGIIDSKGKLLIKPSNFTTSDQKNAYTVFHRLVYNIKRVFEKLPFGSSRIKSYAAALYLIREETGMDESDIIDALDKMGVCTSVDLTESTLVPGEYMLNENVYEASKGAIIELTDTNPVGTFSGINIYKSTSGIYFTENNIK